MRDPPQKAKSMRSCQFVSCPPPHWVARCRSRKLTSAVKRPSSLPLLPKSKDGDMYSPELIGDDDPDQFCTPVERLTLLNHVCQMNHVCVCALIPQYHDVNSLFQFMRSDFTLASAMCIVVPPDELDTFSQSLLD